MSKELTHTLVEDALSGELAEARALLEAAQAGRLDPCLRGKKLALLCSDAGSSAALLFQRAAGALGAHVAIVQPGAPELTTPEKTRVTARLLGRLYDAIECQGLPALLVQQYRDLAGVPVYDGAATAEHPTARLVDGWEGSGSEADKRCAVLQAVLVRSITRGL